MIKRVLNWFGIKEVLPCEIGDIECMRRDVQTIVEEFDVNVVRDRKLDRNFMVIDDTLLKSLSRANDILIKEDLTIVARLVYGEYYKGVTMREFISDSNGRLDVYDHVKQFHNLATELLALIELYERREMEDSTALDLKLLKLYIINLYSILCIAS